MALVTQTFETPGLTTFTLPNGVTEFGYEVHGGGGGGSGWDAGSPGGSGGNGGLVTGTAIGIVGGTTLQLFVASGGVGGVTGGGGAGGTGGTNGGSVSGGGKGGNAGTSGSSGGGGGGGAASYIAIDPGSPSGGTINFNQTYAAGTSISIPAGISTVNYTVKGAQGGGGGGSLAIASFVTSQAAPKGQGGQIISGTLTNVAGKALSIIIGSRGQNGVGYTGGSAAGGTGGGGIYLGGVGAASATLAETWSTSAGGGGGGGDTAIRVASDGNAVAVMAGGGGGSGGAGYSLGDVYTTIYPADTRLSSTFSGGNGGLAAFIGGSAANSGGGGGGAGSPGGGGGTSSNAGNHIAGGVGQGGGGYYNPSYTTDASLGDTNGHRSESSQAINGRISISYTNVINGDAVVIAGGGGGAGGAGNDGSGPSGFQQGGNGGANITTTQNLTQGSGAANNGGDGGGGGGGGGGNPGGSAGFTPGSDNDAGGGTGGGSFYNLGYHSAAPTSSSSGSSTGGGQAATGTSGKIVITYDNEDGQPDSPGNFSDKTNAMLGIAYFTTEEKTVSGINISVPATAVNAVIVKNGSSMIGDTTFVNGDTFKLLVTSAATYNSESIGTIYYGEIGSQVTASFRVTTISVPPNIPDPFSFTDISNQPLLTYVDSNEVTISGLNAGPGALASVSAITGGNITEAAVVINGVEQGATGAISNGDTLKLRVLTSAIPNLTTVASVTVGTGAPVIWNVGTLLTVDTAADPFNFTDISGGVASTQYASNIETITGINSPAAVAISTNFQVNVNGTGWVTPTSTTTISNNQTLQVRGTSGSSDGDVVTAVVQIGGGAAGVVTDDWRISTGTAADSTPSAFNFVDRNNQQGFVTVYSNTVVPGGFDTQTSFSASVVSAGNTSNQEVSFDTGNTWNPVPYAITDYVPGTPVQLRLVTGSYASTGATLSVSIGGVTDTWTVTVLSAPPASGGEGTWMSKRKKEDGYALGTVITIFRQADGNWGNLTGSNTSRYPGFIECDGTSLQASQYPDLFDVIGNSYGGGGFRSSSITSRVYSGSFNIPDFRNRRVFGTGNVDGNSPASPSVVTRFNADDSGTGDSTEVGSEGGNWYIAKVDAAGTPPLEQIQGTGNEGTAGIFYALGTVNTTGYEEINSRVDFNIAGNMSADVGPLVETLVPIPGHTHSAASGRSLNVPIGLMAWGIRAMRWGDPDNFWRRSDDNWSNAIPQGPSDINPGTSYTKTYANFWPSPRDNSLQLDNVKNSGNYQYMGALDVFSGTATANLFTPSGGMLQHNHTLSTTDYGDPNNSFTYGNNNGVGTSFGGAATNNTVEVAFSSSEIGIRANSGSFQLSSSKALIPDVSIRPNKIIPLIQPFFRAKYLIKAF